MSGKNPFDHKSGSGKDKPKPRGSPREAMTLSAGGGLEVLGHSNAPDDYRKRVKVPENLPREQIIKPKPVKTSIPPSQTARKGDNAPANRRAAGVLSTSSGFEIMDNNLPKDNYVKRMRETQELPPAEGRAVIRGKLTGENYIKAYRQQQANDKVELEQKTKTKDKLDKIVEGRKEDNKKFFEQKQKEERKQAETYVVRARQLQSEIALLKRNLGTDTETDRRLQGTIQQLMSELTRIPSAYW